MVRVGESAEDHRIPPLWRLAATALVLAGMEFAVLLLNLQSSKAGFTILWPANGLLLGVLLCAPRRQWPAFLTLGFAINLGTNLALSIALWTSAYFACCNLVEVALAALLLYRTICPRPDLTERNQLLSLLAFGVLLAPAVAAFFAQLGPAGSRSLPFVTSFRMWFVADALGIASVTPLYFSFAQPGRVWNRSWQEVAALFALLCAATVFVFWQTQFPLLFLLLPCLLLLGVRLGLAGSALGLVLVALVGGFMGDAGSSPIMLWPSGFAVSYDLLLQIFIATSMLVLYAIEVATAESKRLQLSLQASEMRFRLLAEASSDVIVLANLLGERRYVSPAATAVLGWESDELIGGNYRQIVHPEDIARLEALMEECRAGNLTEALPYRCRKSDGSYIWMEANLRLYRDAVTGEPIGFVNVVRDISNRRAAEEKLKRAFLLAENHARLDGLTGIANRRRLDEALDSEWRRAMRDHTPVSLLMIDVDHFKPYNDIYGHLSGDICLRTIARTIGEIIHRSPDLLARYGGEEFAVVLPNTDSSGAERLADQIRRAVELLAIPHSGNSHAVVTVSIGCATQKPGQDSVYTELLRAADRALYQAKSAGRNCIKVVSQFTIIG